MEADNSKIAEEWMGGLNKSDIFQLTNFYFSGEWEQEI